MNERSAVIVFVCRATFICEAGDKIFFLYMKAEHPELDCLYAMYGILHCVVFCCTVVTNRLSSFHVGLCTDHT